MSLGFKSQSVGVRANLCDNRTVDIWSMYSRTLLDILLLIWGQTVADYKMLSFHLSINVIIMVSFKILDLCPIALFQQLWNTLYMRKAASVFGKAEGNSFSTINTCICNSVHFPSQWSRLAFCLSKTALWCEYDVIWCAIWVYLKSLNGSPARDR